MRQEEGVCKGGRMGVRGRTLCVRREEGVCKEEEWVCEEGRMGA